MLCKKINYTDFDGNEREEEFYFNLTEAELVEMDYSAVGGFEKTVKAIYEARDRARVIELFKKIILMAYGKKSLDGRQFVKNDEIRKEFESTNAYSKLFMELATDHEVASAFIKGIIPVTKEANPIPPNAK